MAKLKVRYFVEKPGAKGPLYFWQPSFVLRKLGWESERLPDDRTAAIARAEALNAQLDAWRTGKPIAEPAGSMSAKAKTPPLGPQLGTLADVIRRYRSSRFYPSHPKTRRGYEQNIKVLEEWAGDAPVGAITPKRIETLYTGLYAKTPSKANAVITMLRMLLKHAIREEIIKSHPALEADPGLEAVAQSGKLWPIDAISLFVETADRMGWHSMGTAVVINHWIGQRQGDILAMQRRAYREGVFHVTQRKTEARVSVPHSPWVQRRVDAEMEHQRARKITGTPTAALILAESTGKPWREDHFRHVFAAIREAAAAEWRTFFLEDGTTIDMLDLQFMHLRHTAVTELAIAGCTTLQIAGITGHTPKSVEQILTRYLVRTSDLAASATAKRLEMGDNIAALVVVEDVGQDKGRKPGGA
jgi:hypothetical protein